MAIRSVTIPQHETGVLAERKPGLAKVPPMYRVMLLNDDYTPMEFVVMVLQRYFGKSREMATQIMLKVHHEGMGVCGVYTKDIAATKVDLVVAHAKEAGHPLQCVMEEA